MDASSLRPERAGNFEEFAAVLRDLHALADRPSYRQLEERTTLLGGDLPGTRTARVPLRRSTLGDVLAGRTFPRKAFLLTFVEACGVDLHADRRWESAWSALALRRKTETDGASAEGRSTDGTAPAAPSGEHPAGSDPVAERMLQLAKADPRLMARVIEKMSPGEISAIAELVERHPAVTDLFQEMDPEAAGRALSTASPRTTAKLLAHLPPQRAARLLAGLSAEAAGRTLRHLTSPQGWQDRSGERLWAQLAQMITPPAQRGTSSPPPRPEPHFIDVVVGALVSDDSLIPVVRQSALAFPHLLSSVMSAQGRPAASLRIRLLFPATDSGQEVAHSRFFSLPHEQNLLVDATRKLKPFQGEPVDIALRMLALALASEWDTEYANNTRKILVFYSDLPAPAPETEGPPLSAPQASTLLSLHDAWNATPEGDPDWNATKRLVLMAPGHQPWSSLADNWDLTLHFASRVGEGIFDFEMDEVLHTLAHDL